MIVKPRTLDEDTIISSKYFPQGKYMVSAFTPSTNLYNIIKGFTEEFRRLNNLVNFILKDFNVYRTTELIEDWESALGIPDDCFSTLASDERRRQQIIAKLTANGLQTADDIVALGEIFGYTLRVTPASELVIFPVPFEWLFISDPQTSRFTIIIDFIGSDSTTVFPVDFPWPFTGTDVDAVKCFITTLIPAHCQVIFRHFEE